MIKEDNSPAMIDLIRVSKIYPPDVQALVDISLRVNKGEICYLTGMSGAGKTTLLRLLCGIDYPNKGYIEVAGQELSKMSSAEMQQLRRRIGVAYQDFKLLPEKTVAQNIAFSMEVDYRSRSFIRTQIKKLLIQLRLEDKLNTLTGKLSRGEQQRVAIARAVANEPLLILADEPTGNLDTETTELVMNLFHHCNKQGATLLIATHDHSIYNHPGSKVVKIEKGRLITPKAPPAEPAESVVVAKDHKSAKLNAITSFLDQHAAINNKLTEKTTGASINMTSARPAMLREAKI